MKRKLILTAFTLFHVSFSFAQTYYEYVAKAFTAYQKTNYKESLHLYQESFTLDSTHATDLYNGACSAALANEKAVSFELLYASIRNGWTDIGHLQQDGDLQSLHGNTNWPILLKMLSDKIKKSEAGYDKKLQKELEAIYEEDQYIRSKFSDSVAKYGYQHPEVIRIGYQMYFQDSMDQEKVTKILDERGWIGTDLVGKKANEALFLVIQHADLKTQEKYLPLMKDAVKKGNASASGLALLEDRVAIREGRKQIYGSQVGTNTKTNQNYVQPLEDPDNVDKRRATMDLQPISSYLLYFNIIWNVEDYKKHLSEYEKWMKDQY
jgi:hypothetical protein